MTTPKAPDNNPLAVYSTAASTVGQVGCLLGGVIFGLLFLGLLLDRVFDTKPLFLIILLLGSIPLNLWMIYRFTLRKAKSLQASSPEKEETARDD